HAEAEVPPNGGSERVAITIGPQYGPITGEQVFEAVQTAIRNAYDMLIAAGLSFDSSAHDQVQKGVRIPVHFAYIAPDTNETVGSLLKTTKASQLFTVFGQPDVDVQRQSDGN